MIWSFKLFCMSAAIVATLTTGALAQWSIGQRGTREPPQGQNRYVYLVMSDPLPGREFEFNDGYATATLAHSLKMTLTPISLLSTPRPSTSFGPRPRAPNTCQLEAAYPGPAFIGTGLGRAPDGSSWPIVLQKSPQQLCEIRIRNNRIETSSFLNQRCA